ncbi:MAG TPA: RNA-binding protein [Gammaproteobacteria bacterium]|jgi:cold-inducible RNA-binding protein|nr:RNA-binding protein [Gammaproteobacteria bacterium]
MKIYVGNLPWSTTDADLESMFSRVGPVISASVIMDRETGRSRGFGFVEMAQADGQKAIAELNGYQIQSRALRVNEATSQPRRPGGGGGGGGGGRDGGGRDGGGRRW